MFYVVLTALVIYALDVFMTSWKAMAVAASAAALLYVLPAALPNASTVRERARRRAR